MKKVFLASLLLALSFVANSAKLTNPFSNHSKVENFTQTKAYQIGDIVENFSFTATLPSGGTEEASIHDLIDSEKAVLIFFGGYN